jgi:hypothetical protein
MTEGIYRVYVLGDIPPDLKDRIAALHALGILQGKAEGTRSPSQLARSRYGSLPCGDNIARGKPNKPDPRPRSRG